MRLVILGLILASSAAIAWAGPAGSADSVRQIELRFVAPCCRHENLAVHNSPAAAQMRAEIAALVARGDSEERIVNRFVAQYGEQILAEPRGRLFWILTATPVLFSLTASAVLIAALKRLRARAARVPESKCSALPDFDFE
jgi:cytochrome c-type biogenesis protein CcmH